MTFPVSPHGAQYTDLQEPVHEEHTAGSQHTNTTPPAETEPTTAQAEKMLNLKDIGYGDDLGYGTEHREPHYSVDISNVHGTYDPMATLRQRNLEEAAHGPRNQEESEHGPANYPMEQDSRNVAAGGKFKWEPYETHAGNVSIAKGNGNAPYINSKASDYDGAMVGKDYDSIYKALNNKDPKRQEQIAGDLLKMSRGKTPGLDRYTGEEKRAMSHLLTITQLAEQHINRTPGSAALARGSLQRIYDGKSTFKEEFNRTDGNYVPARKAGEGMPGGTQQMRNFLNGTTSYPGGEDAAAAMSEDEA